MEKLPQKTLLQDLRKNSILLRHSQTMSRHLRAVVNKRALLYGCVEHMRKAEIGVFELQPKT